MAKEQTQNVGTDTDAEQATMLREAHNKITRRWAGLSLARKRFSNSS